MERLFLLLQNTRQLEVLVLWVVCVQAAQYSTRMSVGGVRAGTRQHTDERDVLRAAVAACADSCNTASGAMHPAQLTCWLLMEAAMLLLCAVGALRGERRLPSETDSGGVWVGCCCCQTTLTVMVEVRCIREN
jgi:hypothetical protein